MCTILEILVNKAKGPFQRGIFTIDIVDRTRLKTLLAHLHLSPLCVGYGQG